MRSIGTAQRALDTMIVRVTDPAKKTFGKYLYEHGTAYVPLYAKAIILIHFLGTVIADIAKSRAEIESARLLVYSAALQVNISIFFARNILLMYFVD